MKKILAIYCAAVCFFTVACFAVTLGLFLQQTVRILLPQITATSFEEVGIDTTLKQQKGKTQEQTKKAWEANYKKGLTIARRAAIQDMINYSIILLVDLLVFIPHWRIIRRGVKAEIGGT